MQLVFQGLNKTVNFRIMDHPWVKPHLSKIKGPALQVLESQGFILAAAGVSLVLIAILALLIYCFRNNPTVKEVLEQIRYALMWSAILRSILAGHLSLMLGALR